jgi:hypothetical protein
MLTADICNHRRLGVVSVGVDTSSTAPAGGNSDQQSGTQAQDCAQASLLVTWKTSRGAALGTRGGHHRRKGDARRHFADAHMSDIGAVLLIFVMLAVALTAVKRRHSRRS